MNIQITTPAPAGSRTGNRVTAQRWARLLRALGHRVTIATEYCGGRCDVLVALHARKSAPSVERYRKCFPEGAVVVALTGTDLYADIETTAVARHSLQCATRIIVLQPLGIDELPAPMRSKTRVIHQSATPPTGSHHPSQTGFQVCVLGHLRPVKDPLRTAAAARLLPTISKIRVVHVGAPLTSKTEALAQTEMKSNPRYRWLGGRPRWQALRTLARSRLLVLTSRSEGGANVISEALAASVPIVASKIPGSVGILGADYPGYYPVGDTKALAQLLERAERSADFYGQLSSSCARVKPLVHPERERRAWMHLLRELNGKERL